MKRVVIVGGGISGLTAAYKIRKKSSEANLPIEVLLIEEKKRLGGIFLTEKANDFLIEGGPDSFESEKPHTLALAEELGIAERVIGCNEEAHLTFIFWNNKLWSLPRGLLALAPTRISSIFLCPLLSWSGKMRALLDFMIPPLGNKDEEISLAEFYKRRFGKEVFDRVVEPLLGSIYACIPEIISIKSCWPRALILEKEYGSLLRGMLARRKMAKKKAKQKPVFMTFKEGMSELTNTLAEHIGSENFITGRKPVSLKQNSGKGFTLLLDDGGTITADACILATAPSYATAQIVRNIDPSLADILLKIPYVSSATISLGYEREKLSHPLQGFGVLVSRQEKLQIKAISWSSTKFAYRAPEGYVLIRCFIGTAQGEGIVYQSDEEILKVVKEELKKIMGINSEPILTKIYRWENSMPQYLLGHGERVRFIEQRLTHKYPGLYLIGNAYHGIGINDCIYNATQAAEGTIEFLGK
ncbi:MAG: protoporphyrinogen oxidase [Actinomycetota bacterium]|nr:protoporphyrinogen oxidase [Actinomycetota bacterium]